MGKRYGEDCAHSHPNSNINSDGYTNTDSNPYCFTYSDANVNTFPNTHTRSRRATESRLYCESEGWWTAPVRFLPGSHHWYSHKLVLDIRGRLYLN